MGSDSRTFRPIGVIAVMWAVVVVLVVLTVAIGSRLPDEASFTTGQTVTIWVLIALTAVAAGVVSLSRVRADEESISFTNGVRHRTLAWDEVAGFSMSNGAPWPTVVTRDDRRFILFAIQGSEGAAANDAVAWLSRHVR